jgi:dolichol-phosphate mannosyltransferase
MSGSERAEVCVIIPTYNEAGTIGELIRALDVACGVFGMRMVVIDDGSRDGTLEIVREMSKGNGRIVLLERSEKLGLGSAIIEGMKTALSLIPPPDFVVTMDADMSHDPDALPSMIKSCSTNGLVIGSRYVEGGSTIGWGSHRRIISGLANLLARGLVGIAVKDCTSGYRCYHRDLVAGMLEDLGCDGYDFQIQALFEASRRASEIRELPITFRDRESGESKMALGEVLRFASQLYSLHRRRAEYGEGTQVVELPPRSLTVEK